VLSALALFFFTAVAGRLWCGYACPQTVYTEIFLWIERRIEGDRIARMRLDAALGRGQAAAQGRQARRLAGDRAVHRLHLRRLLHADPRRWLADTIATCGSGPWEWFWMLFYGAATYGNAGYLREQICKYMCPYARFQSALIDAIRSSSPTTRHAATRAVRARARPTRAPRAWATASTARCACRSARPASTSATVCRTNASAARPASTSATVMERVGYARTG
jgi:hypothetical protein